jgi:hypothetical protein
MTLDGQLVIRNRVTSYELATQYVPGPGNGSMEARQYYAPKSYEHDCVHDPADFEIRFADGRTPNPKQLRKVLAKPVVAVLPTATKFDPKDYEHLKKDTLVLRSLAPRMPAPQGTNVDPGSSGAPPGTGVTVGPQVKAAAEPAVAKKTWVGVVGYPQAALNEKANFTILVKNVSDQPLKGVEVKVELTGFVDADGKTSLKQTVAEPIAPGDTFRDTLTLTAKKKGLGTIRLVAVAGSDSEETTVSVMIDEAGKLTDTNAGAPPTIYVIWRRGSDIADMLEFLRRSMNAIRTVQRPALGAD